MFNLKALGLVTLLGLGGVATLAPEAVQANTHVDAVCRMWVQSTGAGTGNDSGARIPCRVQFDGQGAVAITAQDGTTVVRGLNGVTNGYTNKECLRDQYQAVCPIGDFGF